MRKKFLVTGGAGYIGSHFVLRLLQEDFDVVIFDNLETGHQYIIDALQSFKGKGNICEFIKGDLKNPADIKQVFEKHNFDAVIHFAAYSLVNESVKHPQKYYDNNVVGSFNLINAMVDANVLKIVFSSTAAVYGEPKQIPIQENDPKNPVNPYGQSKLVVEKILDEYDKFSNLKSIRLRYFNVIGANKDLISGEWHDTETHLVPNILKSLTTTGQIFSIFGDDYPTKDGTCIRDYIDVEDLAQAHFLALKYLLKNNKTDIFNLGTGLGSSVKDIFNTCEKTTGKKIPLEIKPKREGDPSVLIADNTKAKMILEWQTKAPLENSIENAWKWEQKLTQIIHPKIPQQTL
ncbi:MAG: UDP-glucose 4-epimerase GalE [Candidatus Gastranaerophilales bacterium]|nr:UDP-glucose 4-epimerase GalE [Candidatus Gastranaerophilales bacterium]